MMKVKVFFAWYDFWIGVYFDRINQDIYICPLPMVGIKVSIKWLKIRASHRWMERLEKTEIDWYPTERE